MTEFRLLRWAVGWQDSPAPGRAAADWDRLEALAATHGLLPALDLDALAPPRDARERLRRRQRELTQAGLRLTEQLHAVLGALEEASIRAIPYKGPVLSAAVHGDPAARQYVDVDVVVPPSEFGAARRALRGRDYRPVERLHTLGEVAFETDGVTVDLHRSVLPRYFPGTLAFDDVWARRDRVDVGGRAVPALDPADRALVLAVHGTKHCWYRLAWVHDVAALIVDGRTDRAAVRERARDLGCRRHLALGAELSGRLFGVDGPPDGSAAVDDLADRCERRLREASPPSDREQFAVQWRALTGPADRLRYAVALATIPTAGDLDSVSLPPRLHPLYRAVRPTRLAVQCGRRMLSRIRSGTGRNLFEKNK